MAQNLSITSSERIINKDGTPSLAFLAKYGAMLKRLEELEATAAAAPTTYVAKDTTASWTAWTGTADRATHATYTAAAISNPPTQAQVQAIANAAQNNSRGMKALTDDLLTSEAIK